MHKNPTDASAGERNHKSAKRVHSHNQARLGASKVEIGTTIVFNAKQLQRRHSVMCNGWFLRWLSKIGTTENDLQAFEEDEEDEEDEQEGDLEDFLDEFVDVNIWLASSRFRTTCCSTSRKRSLTKVLSSAPSDKHHATNVTTFFFVSI